MTTPIATSTTDSQMHNNIMAAGSRDRPPMLATGRYAQWRSRFLRYIDTRPNGDSTYERAFSQSDSSEYDSENKAHYKFLKKKAIQLILTGIERKLLNC
ncbi:hypothetical protein Tco_0415811 [Tanacetum coccineum]